MLKILDEGVVQSIRGLRSKSDGERPVADGVGERTRSCGNGSMTMMGIIKSKRQLDGCMRRVWRRRRSRFGGGFAGDDFDGAER